MKISFPHISQEDFEYAILCLEACKQDHAKNFGFRYPYFAPGGAYGQQWWQLDSSLALCGYKWVDRAFAETSLQNFIESQKADGRICLWGADVLPGKVAGDNYPQQTENVSSLPKLFHVAYSIAEGSKNKERKCATYDMLKKYADWWFSHRQDKKTGLITAVFEETFIPYLGCAGEYAPVDTNVEVYVGCHYVGLLATELGRTKDAEEMEAKKRQLKESINRYLWNEERGAYFPYYVKEERLSDCLMASTFFPLRLGIARKDQRTRLIELLRSHEHFNWNSIPLTSVSKKDSAFVTTKGAYQGNASWSGNVWTLINEMVVQGLCDSGENELAAELAVKTVYAFNHNCAEFVNPFDGSGQGVLQYAWSASQYLELLIETIFGVCYRAEEKLVTISPRLTKELKEHYLALENIPLEKDVYLNVEMDHGIVSCSVSSAELKVEILPEVRKTPFSS